MRAGVRGRGRSRARPLPPRRASGREALAAELGGAPIAGADLTREDEVDRLFAEARAALGAVDVCAAVAGVWPQADEPVWQLPLDRWEETLRANLTATS